MRTTDPFNIPIKCFSLFFRPVGCVACSAIYFKFSFPPSAGHPAVLFLAELTGVALLTYSLLKLSALLATGWDPVMLG